MELALPGMCGCQARFTQQVDYPLVVSCKKPDRVFEEEHEGCVYNPVSELVGIDLYMEQVLDFSSQNDLLLNNLKRRT